MEISCLPICRTLNTNKSVALCGKGTSSLALFSQCFGVTFSKFDSPGVVHVIGTCHNVVRSAPSTRNLFCFKMTLLRPMLTCTTGYPVCVVHESIISCIEFFISLVTGMVSLKASNKSFGVATSYFLRNQTIEEAGLLIGLLILWSCRYK